MLANDRTVGRPVRLGAVAVGVHESSAYSCVSCGVRVRSAGASREHPASQPTNRRCVLSTARTRHACVPVCLCAMTGFPIHMPGISNTARQQPAGSLSSRSA